MLSGLARIDLGVEGGGIMAHEVSSQSSDSRPESGSFSANIHLTILLRIVSSLHGLHAKIAIYP